MSNRRKQVNSPFLFRLLEGALSFCEIEGKGLDKGVQAF